MSFSEILVIYLCVLTLQAVSYAVIVVIGARSRERTKPFSPGEKRYIVLRLLVFILAAAIGWLMFLSPRLYNLIIPITAFLDFGGMFVMMLASKRIVQFFDAKHAA